MERTAPVFLALIASDKDDTQHRYHGQLGYVLEDERTPDFAGAERDERQRSRFETRSLIAAIRFTSSTEPSAA